MTTAPIKISAQNLVVGCVIVHPVYGTMEITATEDTHSEDGRLRIRCEAGSRVIFFQPEQMVMVTNPDLLDELRSGCTT